MSQNHNKKYNLESILIPIENDSKYVILNMRNTSQIICNDDCERLVFK